MNLCQLLLVLAFVTFSSSKLIGNFKCNGNNCVFREIQSTFELIETLNENVVNSEVVNKITTVSFEISSFAKIPTILFENFTNLELVFASKVQLKEINRDDFKFAVNLRILKLPWNNITKLGQKLFVHLKALEQLDLSHNQIEWIDEKAFEENGGKLKQVNLSFNKIKVFDEIFFLQLSGMAKYLQSVNLERNEIAEIVKSSEVHEVLVEILDLGNNKLKKFYMTNVKVASKLVLDDNDIERLTVFGVDHLSIRNNKLQELFIKNETNFLKAENNELSMLKCDECKHVSLSRNENGWKILDDLKSAANLSSLQMSETFLSSLNTKSFASFHKLRSLKIDRNRISFIPDGVYTNQKLLQHLNLSHNVLSSISVHAFLPLQSLTILDISGNRILKIHGYENMRKTLPLLSFIGVFGNKLEHLPQLLQSLKSQSIKTMQIGGTMSFSGIATITKVPTDVISVKKASFETTSDEEISAEITEVHEKLESKPLNQTERNEFLEIQETMIKLLETSNFINKILLIVLSALIFFTVHTSWCLRQNRETLKLYHMQYRRMMLSKRSSISTLAAFEDTFY